MCVIRFSSSNADTAYLCDLPLLLKHVYALLIVREASHIDVEQTISRDLVSICAKGKDAQ